MPACPRAGVAHCQAVQKVRKQALASGDFATGLDFPGAAVLGDESDGGELDPEYDSRDDMLMPRAWFEVGAPTTALATLPYAHASSLFVLADAVTRSGHLQSPWAPDTWPDT